MLLDQRKKVSQMTEQAMPANEAPASPVPLTPKAPVKVKTMTFPEAMKEIIDGKKVARQSWSPAKDYGFLKDRWLTIFVKGEFHTWTVNDADMVAKDWVIIG